MTAEKDAGNNRWLAWICIAIAVFIIAGAVGVFPLEPANNTPLWVVGLSGAVFGLGGIMILLGPKSPLTALGAALMCVSFGAIAAWIALFAAPDSISGGLPFLSTETNGKIGKWIFGLGALVCFAIARVAWRQFRTTKSE